MEWPLSIPDPNPIKNLWSIVKMELYEAGKQYNWKAIKTTMSEIEPAEVKKKKKMNKSLDYWLLLQRRITILKWTGT